MKLKEFPTVDLAEKKPESYGSIVEFLNKQYSLPAFENSLTASLFKSDSSADKAINSIAIGSVIVSASIYSAGLIFAEQPADAAPDPNVAAVVTTITDTIPIMTGIAMLVLSAGLAPWAARTCLHWLSSIIRGAI
ncbi:MAG TPA: hypothetical protein VK211_23775 [Kamptonema sp.]|nr:hypothetical protein [Kamptonema sp.]